MATDKGAGTRGRWEELRFAIVGNLLASPPEAGELQAALVALSAKTWRHPKSGLDVRLGVSTIERWYHLARRSTSPVEVLRRKSRADKGGDRALWPDLKTFLLSQYAAHPSWSYQLHRDNVVAWTKKSPEQGAAPSYSSVKRFLLSKGLVKKRRQRPFSSGLSPGGPAPSANEKRSFEVEYVSGLWHLDFHHSSRRVLTRRGEWIKPLLLGVLDDHSRLICHAQWYEGESAQELIHGLEQALLKRGLPRVLMTDNGSAMLSSEHRQGLRRLSILHETTLPYSPYQNGKQEVFWGQIEGRVMPLLEGEPDITLARLNLVTQAFVEMEYHRKVHSETGKTPLDRFLDSPSVARPCPSLEWLRQAFTAEAERTLRRSDGTFTLDGVRFEVPSRFHHFRKLTLRYRSWDLSDALLADPESGNVLARLFPLDRQKNAGQKRRPLGDESSQAQAATTPPRASPSPPLLDKLLADYAATGLPPALLPLEDENDDKGDQ